MVCLGEGCKYLEKLCIIRGPEFSLRDLQVQWKTIYDL